MFLTFLAFLAGGAILPVVVFSTGQVIGLVGLSVPVQPVEGASSRRAIAYGRILMQVYVWFAWAAYCAWLALRFGAAPTVTNPWVYYVVALFATGLPVTYLHFNDVMSAGTADDHQELRAATNLWRTILFFACVIFLVVPTLMQGPYGWFAHAEQSVIGEAARHLSVPLRAAEHTLDPGPTHRLRTRPDARGPVSAAIHLGWVGGSDIKTTTVHATTCTPARPDQGPSMAPVVDGDEGALGLCAESVN